MALRLGSGSASSLIRSASSTASAIQAYNDSLAAAEFQNSSMTADDFNKYAQYLQGRIGTLSNTGGVASASKALSLSNTLTSANRAFTSNEIQRQSIGIMEGNSTSTDKYSTLVGLYQRAVSNGDENLAQNLRQQADSLSQQMQYDAQQASNSYASLAKANGVAQEQGYNDAATAIKSYLGDFEAGFKGEGQGPASKAEQAATKPMADLAKSLGVDFPKGASFSNGSLIEAAFNTMGALYGKAGDIATVIPGESATAQSYQNKIHDIMNGATKLSFGGQAFSIQDAKWYAQHPDAYYATASTTDDQGNPIYNLNKSSIKGYSFDQNGAVTPVYTVKGIGMGDQMYGLQSTDNQNQIKQDLTGAGFTVKSSSSEVGVSPSTDGKNAFFQKALSSIGIDPKQFANVDMKVIPQGVGNYQVKVHYAGQDHLLSLVKDDSGKFGVYQLTGNTTANGQANRTYNLIGAFDGFNTLDNQITRADPNSSVVGGLKAAFGNTNWQSQNGYTEKTIIPQIAQKYFNGNLEAAKGAVYSYRKPLEQVAQNNPVLAGTGAKPGLALNPAPYVASKPGSPAHVGPVLSLGLGIGNVVNGNHESESQALTRLFANYHNQAAFYTEKNIIPTLENEFHLSPGAAQSAAYGYRKSAGLEGPAPSSAPAPAPRPLAMSSGMIYHAPAPQKPSMQQYMQQQFQGWQQKGAFYTENTIMKNVANNYYGGNVNAAKGAVYGYRMANFGK